MVSTKAQPGKAVRGGKKKVFYVATYTSPLVDGAGTIFIPAPDPNPLSLNQLMLEDGVPQRIHEAWLESDDLQRYIDLGQVVIVETDRVPRSPVPELDPNIDLDDNQKQFVWNFLRHWPHNEQLRQAATIGSDHINPKTGMPKASNSAVTVTFLKTKHLLCLNAMLDLEGRWKNRSDVLDFLKKEIQFIEKL